MSDAVDAAPPDEVDHAINDGVDHPIDDGVDDALAALVTELGACIASLDAARERATELQHLRADGTDWLTAVRSEEPPLIVERISGALQSLNTVGGRWRRREAAALHAAGMSINEIARLFGVTRQRASVLVRDPDERR